MNSASVTVTLILLSCLGSSFAQVKTPAERQAAKEQVIQQVCRGAEITSGPEVEEVHRIVQRLAPILNQDKHRTYIALANNNEINAWATNFNMTDSVICVPVAMVHFMGDAEGELAFIISHEIGHTVDDVCKTQEGQVAIANSRGSLGALFGGVLGGQQGAAAASKTSQQRGCEARADEIGFRIFTASGQNPFGAAGAFARLEMYMGDTSTGVLALLNALGRVHPMTPDRIQNMRPLRISYEQEH